MSPVCGHVVSSFRYQTFHLSETDIYDSVALMAQNRTGTKLRIGHVVDRKYWGSVW